MVDEALEAAHIVPYLGPRTNHVRNGLLLRADVHTLFDRGLLGLDPATWRVVLDPRLAHTEYAALADRAPTLPEAERDHPSADALRRHLAAAGLAGRSRLHLVPA